MKKLRHTTLLIMLRTVLCTVDTLTRFWWGKLRGKADRAFIDYQIHRWAVNMLKIPDVQLQLAGEKPIYAPHQPYIIMSNHSSLYDIPIIFSSMPGSIRMIAKKELSYIPYFGVSLKHSEFIFIDRANRAVAIEDLKRAKTKMLNGIIIWAAPEGTRTRTGELGPFKKGIFKLAKETDAIIIPVAIRGAFQLLKPKTWRFKVGQNVQVRIAKPIYAKEWDEQHLSDNVRKAIQDLL